MATSTARFTLNFVGNTIVGTKASFDKAGKGSGPIYDELVALMVKHPTFGFEVKKQEKRSAKPKKTYRGMDIPFMRDYLAAVNDAKTLNTFDAAVAFAKASGKSVYPLAKRVLFDAYAAFDYTTAKKVVSKYRHTQAVAKAMLEAAGNTSSAASSRRIIERPKSDYILLPPASSF